MDSDGHCERFNELPEETKLFLEKLTPEKIAALEKGMDLSRKLEIIGGFWKWTILFMLGAFTSVAGAMQAYDWLRDRFLKGG